MPNNNIEIDLSSSNYNRHINSGALIQQKAFDALGQQIRKDLDQAKSCIQQGERRSQYPSKNTDVLYPPGSGLTYFIDGTRGAGKSTFLNFTYEYLNERLKDDSKSNTTFVQPLLYLDPSRIEASEILLLHILKHLKHLMDGCTCRGHDWGKQQEEFRDLFKQMAGGLHLFVSKADSLKDLDAELFLDYGLDRAADSQRLRNLLHRTIDLVCKALNTRALLVAIDDADTKFANAIDALECIRKYLDTPQLVALVTGDMEMYSLLVQNHFQHDFASNSQGFSPDRETQQNRMVAHLEEQYLLKLFPIQRRIQLKTLHTLTESDRKIPADKKTNNEPTYILIVPEHEKLGLLDAIKEIATDGLRLRHSKDVGLFCQHILKLPVRSVLQLLATYFKLKANSHSEREAAAEALRAVSLSSLYRYDVDVEGIAEGNLHAAMEAAFDLGLLDGEPDTAIYLRPQARDASLRNAYVSLAADVARLSEKAPHKSITYMLTTAGSSNIYHLVNSTERRQVASKNTGYDEESLKRKVKQYLSIGREDSALNWAWHATATLIETSTSNYALRQGIIGVRVGTKPDDKGNKPNTFDTQIKKAFKASSKEEGGPSYPAIAFSQSGVKQFGNTQRYLSIYNILGLIANLLSINESKPQERREKIRDQLERGRNTPTVSLPDWQGLASLTDDYDELEDTDEAEETDAESSEPRRKTHNEELDIIVGRIDIWLQACDQLKKFHFPSAVLMGKIWNRLYFSLDNISSASRSETYNDIRCAKAMELFAWALINACLVEEVIYHQPASDRKPGPIKLNNPRTSGIPVIEKFINNKPAPEIAPLTFMIASCPLVLGLINRKGTNKTINPTHFVLTIQDLLKSCKINNVPDVQWICEPEVWSAVSETTVSMSGTSGSTSGRATSSRRSSGSKTTTDSNLSQEQDN